MTEAPNIQSKPFQRTKLDYERDEDSRLFLTVPLNTNELEILGDFMKLTRMTKQATALKVCMCIARNVVRNQFDEYSQSRLFKKK